MNATLLGVDSLPRGGEVTVETTTDAGAPGFTVRAKGQNARMLEEVQKAAMGEPSAPLDGRSIQAYLTHKLAKGVNAGLTVSSRDGVIELVAG
jgi:histidine phosphotransferase ChpT